MVPTINYAVHCFSTWSVAASKGCFLAPVAPGFCTVLPSANHQQHTGVKGVFLFRVGFHRTAEIKPARKGLKMHSGWRILARLESLLTKRKCPIELQFSLHKCPKPSWQGFRPPQNQSNARLNLVNSSLKKCPKPSGQGLRPPPPYRQCPNATRVNFSGASLSSL